MNKQDIEILKKTIKEYARVTHVIFDPSDENKVWKLRVVTKDRENSIVIILTDAGDIYHLKGNFHLDFLNLLQSILKDIKRDKK